jgi:hypothetical protein
MKKNFKTQAINSHDWWLNPYVCWFISPTSNSIDSAAFKRCHELLILRVSPHHLPLLLTRLHQHQLNLARWVVTPAKTTTLLKSKSSLSRGQSNGWKSGCVFLELTIAGWWKCETYIGMDQDCGMDHDGSKTPISESFGDCIPNMIENRPTLAQRIGCLPGHDAFLRSPSQVAGQPVPVSDAAHRL